jgi:arachidonate 15-lipoxygenase
MTPLLLPQHDPDSERRAVTLDNKRKDYAITFDKYPFLPMAASLPAEENPPKAWSDLVGNALQEVLKNDVRADKGRVTARAGFGARAHELAVALAGLPHSGAADVINDIVSLVMAGDMLGAAQSVDDYRVFFKTVPVPPLASTFHTDSFFSRKPLCGADPEILERVRALDDAFPVTDADLQQVSPGDGLKSAVADGRLFQADFGMVAGAPPNELGGAKRFVFAPRVMYAVPRAGGTLRAFAIQIGRTPGSNNPIFTPADGWGWRIAKTHADAADTAVGALWFHHARTHLVAEPMILAAHRQLAPSHPLLRLLLPHFQGTLSINETGYKTVFAAHGVLDWFTGTPRETVREVALQSVRTFGFNDSIFPRRMRLRGVDDASVLTDFPFRDDGMLIWNAITEWVGSYVNIYYSSDADVNADTELQAWLREVTAPDGGGLKGIGQEGALRTRSYLVDAISQIIFSGSALHSAMNFPVQEEMAFVPNSPFGVYRTPPTSKAGLTEKDWLALLPPLDQAQRQFSVAYLLGASRYGKLGDYGPGWFDDPRIKPALERFRARLLEVEGTIAERNRNRPEYIHLKPSRIAPSINI